MAARIVPTRAQRVETGELERQGFFTVPVMEVRVTEVQWSPPPGCFHAHSVGCDDPVPEEDE